MSTERPHIVNVKKTVLEHNPFPPSFPELPGLLHRVTGCQTPDLERIKEGARENHFYMVV